MWATSMPTGLKKFKSYGAKQFIDVCIIDRCVGFLEIGNISYIIDKVIDNPDDSGNLYLETGEE